MTARVIAFPGVTLTEDAPARPAPISTPCRVCSYPIRSNESEGVIDCSRCGAVAHEPCFWRLLPLEEWIAYIRWITETEEVDRDYICAACREKEGA